MKGKIIITQKDINKCLEIEKLMDKTKALYEKACSGKLQSKIRSIVNLVFGNGNLTYRKVTTSISVNKIQKTLSFNKQGFGSCYTSNDYQSGVSRQEYISLHALQETLDYNLEKLLLYFKDDSKKERVRRIRKLLNKYKIDIYKPHITPVAIIHVNKQINSVVKTKISPISITQIKVNGKGTITSKELPYELGRHGYDEYGTVTVDINSIISIQFVSKFYKVLKRSLLKLQKQLEAIILSDEKKIKDVETKVANYLVADKL